MLWRHLREPTRKEHRADKRQGPATRSPQSVGSRSGQTASRRNPSPPSAVQLGNPAILVGSTRLPARPDSKGPRSKAPPILGKERIPKPRRMAPRASQCCPGPDHSTGIPQTLHDYATHTPRHLPAQPRATTREDRAALRNRALRPHPCVAASRKPPGCPAVSMTCNPEGDPMSRIYDQHRAAFSAVSLSLIHI